MMVKIIKISRPDLTSFAFYKANVSYDGIPPDERNKEMLLNILTALFD